MMSALAQMSTVESPVEPAKTSSYAQILQSTAWVGGSQVINIAIGIVRTKAMAVLLGPAGFGLTGLYGSVAGLTQSLAGLGINSSGVRQIAEAAGSGEQERIARTAAVLRWVSLGLGVLGALLLLTLANPISRVTFGTDQRAGGVALLSLVVFLNLVAAGQGALIQGMRRIADLAKMNVLGAALGTAAALPLIYWLGERGVVPSLITAAAVGLAASWWYSRGIQVGSTRLDTAIVREEGSALARLGVAFLVSNLLMMSSAYVIRVIVSREAGMEATGYYQAAWTVGGLYVGMILQSMGADFYPRLTAVAADHAECNRLVNEQAQVSMLLAGPGVIATLVFAPWALSLLYAAKFAAAVELLRWICLGIAMRVISWPMGFIIMAQGRQNVIILCEVAWTVVHLCLGVVLVSRYGVDGAGMAFFGSYLFHIALTYAVVRSVSGFRWVGESWKTLALYVPLLAIAYASSRLLAENANQAIGAAAVAVSGLHAVRTAARLWRPGRIGGRFRLFA